MPANTNPTDDQTIQGHVCPRCNGGIPAAQMASLEYRCPQCGFEQAYLEYTHAGAIKKVLGWVKRHGAVLLERYEVITILGRGGFGATYLVKDLRLSGKRRAVKEIPQNIFDENEPLMLSRLDHPHIPDIMDRFEADGMIYLVLEFAGGHSLGDKCKEMGGRIPLAVLAPWICQLCDVLGYLHAQQPPIIHRDLKPDNILLDEKDRLMLVDFGIAKIGDKSEETRTLGRAVSYNYSSPEQIMGTGTDQQSDVFSLGATLYFLLTGQHAPAINRRLSETLKPLSTLLAGIPPEIDRAIIQALDLNPDKRTSIQEMGRVFHSFAQAAASDRKAREGVRARNRMILLAIPLVLLLAAVITIFHYWRSADIKDSSQANRQEASHGLEDSTSDQPPAATPAAGRLASPIPWEPAPPASPPVIPAPPAAKPVSGAPAVSSAPADEVAAPGAPIQKKNSKKIPSLKRVEKAPVPDKKSQVATELVTPPPVPAVGPVTKEKEKQVDWNDAMQWGGSREKVQ